jgi:hypothetical protein
MRDLRLKKILLFAYLLYEDLSVRLVQWIELLRILGTKKVFLYELEAHPNITKVLNYYQKNVVDLTKITLPGN